MATQNAQYSTSTVLAGLTKEVYGENLERIPLDIDIVQTLIPYEKRAKLGNKYHLQIMLTHEQGFTYNGTSGSVNSSMTAAVAAESGDCQVQGYEVIGRSKVAYKILEEAAEAGPQAFEDATKLILENLALSASKRFELSLLYGQEGLGVVSANASGVLTITDASWSAGTWSDMENAVLEAWTATTATATQHNGDLVVTSVDLVNKTVTVSGTNAAVVANDILYFKGARTATTWNEMAGVHKVLNTTSGTLFNISSTDYSRWRSNTKGTVGAFNFSKVLSGLAQPAARGLKKRKMNVLIPTAAYEVVNSDLSGARRYDGSYSKGKLSNGTEAIEFIGQTGTSMLIPHPYLRDGDALAFPEGIGKRVGCREFMFMRNNRDDAGDIWFQLESATAKEVRCWYDQAVFFERPSWCLAYGGITYS